MGQQNNPYAVTPARASAIMPGFNLLKGAIKNRGEAAIAQAKDKKARGVRKIGVELLKTGSPEEIAEFMLINPEIGKELKGAIGFKNEETERRLLETVRGVYTGELDPVEGPAAHAGKLIKEGADASHTMGLMETSIQDPEMGREEAGKIWAALDSKGLIDYKKAMSGPAAAKDTRTKDEKNYDRAIEGGFDGSILDYQIAMGSETKEIKNFKFGEKNPKFALNLNNKKDAIATKANAGKSFKNTMDLRKEFLSQSGDYQKVRDAYTRVVGSTQDPSPAGDLSLIFNYMKMLDPGSVVRESEFATAAAAGSYGERIQAAAQKALSGERLSPNMRKDFLEKSGVLMQGMKGQHKKREKSYGDIADKNNLARDEVVMDINIPQASTAEGQAANTGQLTETQYNDLPAGSKFTYGGKEYTKGATQ